MSFPRAKALSFELEHNSTVSWHSCSPAYYRARNLGDVWCTASGSSIQPEGPGVWCTSHMCASLYALADHGLCEFIFWKHLFSVLVNKTINDDHMETTSWPPQEQEKLFIWPPFSQCRLPNHRIIRPSPQRHLPKLKLISAEALP